MEHNIEEVKVLQTVTLLLTTNLVVHGDTLAKALVLCFRLHYTKNPTIVNTAGATIRQLVSLVFERVYLEKDSVPSLQQQQQHASGTGSPDADGSSTHDSQTFALDAFHLFQDLVQLVNAEQPYWLVGMTEMTRTFGLELLEAVLSNFSAVFHEVNKIISLNDFSNYINSPLNLQNQEFRLLLKERVCALVIKLFSPNVKHRQLPAPSNGNATVPADKPYFPISMRLLRLVAILIQKYHTILVTECEIFLSLIIKFLDPEKPHWQRALALEVIHKLVTRSTLIAFFCKSYDLKSHATHIVHDMIAAMGSYVRYSLINASAVLSNGGQQVGGVAGQQPSTLAALAGGGNNQCGFMFRGAYLPLVATFAPGVSKAV